MTFARFTIAYWCVLAAALLPIVCAGIAKYGMFATAPGKGGYDNNNPRSWLARQTDWRGRANAAQANMQTDPTVIYGLWLQTGKPVLNIRKIDLQTPNRYNTYTIPGLPAGPISNPGLASLEAAANPAQSEYLYFVSRNDGTTVFSKDYGQHSKAVNKFQVDPKGRAGKSWHDLNKKKPTADVHTVPAKAPSKKASKN